MKKWGISICALIVAVSQFCTHTIAAEDLKDKEILVYSDQEDQGFRFTPEQTKSGYIGDFVKWALEDMGQIPAKDSWLFVGSSSMRMWRDVKKDMAPLNIIHRGFGGSTMANVMQFKNFFARYKAANIVVYEGDNDLNTTDLSKVEPFLKNCQDFIDYIHASEPETNIFFLSPKPSISRWDKRETYEKARVGLKEITEKSDKVHYIDIATPMLGEDGTPKKEIFGGDNLHMNLNGYKIWTDVIRNALGLKPLEK